MGIKKKILNKTTSDKAFNWEKKNGVCYLCGVPFNNDIYNLGGKQLECEHVLSIFLALRLMSIVREKKYTDEQWNILNYEYELSHKCCNRIKDQIAFIKSNNNVFTINEAEIDALYESIFKQSSMGCTNVKANMISHHGNEVQAKIKARTFLNKRLQYILTYINMVRGGASIEWGNALKNFNIFKHISIDGTQIFQLHLCHSIINALKVLTIEQLFIIVDRSGTIKTEFNQGQQAIFDDLIIGEDLSVIHNFNSTRESKNGGGKTNKNQKGGTKNTKLVSSAIKALKKEFMKIVMSDEPIIKEIDIFKHFLLTYGGQYGPTLIKPHTHYYVNNGDLEIVGSLTNGEKVLYDDTVLNNNVREIFETVKKMRNSTIPAMRNSQTQFVEQNKERALYYKLIQMGMNHSAAIKLIQEIITNGNLTKALTVIRNSMIQPMNSIIQPMNSMTPPTMRTQTPVYGGKKKTRKMKRKKKRKKTRKNKRRK